MLQYPFVLTPWVVSFSSNCIWNSRFPVVCVNAYFAAILKKLQPIATLILHFTHGLDYLSVDNVLQLSAVWFITHTSLHPSKGCRCRGVVNTSVDIVAVTGRATITYCMNGLHIVCDNQSLNLNVKACLHMSCRHWTTNCSSLVTCHTTHCVQCLVNVGMCQ